MSPSLQRLRSQLLAVVVGLIALELASYGGIWVLGRATGSPILRKADLYANQTRRIRSLLAPDPGSHVVIDSVLGWRFREGLDVDGDVVNAQGLRSEREYAATAPAGVTRVAAFGDSFVYGAEVTTRESWTSQVERSLSDVEVLNYGVNGYGLDQAYLRYRAEGEAFSPRIVLIGFDVDDIGRLVNVCRAFIGPNEPPLVKPRFELASNGELILLSPPIRDSTGYARLADHPDEIRALGEHDAWFDPAIYDNPLYDYSATVRLMATVWTRVRKGLDRDRFVARGVLNGSSEAFKIQVALFDRFAADVVRQGAMPVIVFFPDKRSVAELIGGEPAIYEPLRTVLAEHKLRHIDLGPDFVDAARRDGLEALFAPGTHYSAAGNVVAANAVARFLSQTRQAPDT